MMRTFLDSELQTLELDGISIHFDLLRSLANPDSERFYRLVRDGDIVTVQSFELKALSQVIAQQSEAAH
jgi:hypothetical protein